MSKTPGHSDLNVDEEAQDWGDDMRQFAPGDERKFHGWRLLGVIFMVIVVLALVSAVVDWAVIGPLEGRVFD